MILKLIIQIRLYVLFAVNFIQMIFMNIMIAMVNVLHVTFSTHRPDCKYKYGKEHEYGDVEQYDVDQEDCDRWNKTNFLDKHWEPNTVYKRYCKNCDDVKIIQLSFGSPVLEDF